MVLFLVWVVGPVAITAALARAFRIGGWRLMWKGAAALSAALLLFSAFQPEVTFYYAGPLMASGCYTWPWPIAPIAVGAVVHALSHPKVPVLVRVVPAALSAWIAFQWAGWIA